MSIGLPMRDLDAIATDSQVARGTFKIQSEGKRIEVPALLLNAHAIVVKGKWVKIAALYGEDWLDGNPAGAPDQLITNLRQHKELRADLFVFTQKPTGPGCSLCISP